jgi:LysM domain-containing protein
MTIIDTWHEPAGRAGAHAGFRPMSARNGRNRCVTRPAGAAMQYRGSGVLMSRASHRRRPVTPATTVALALLAALTTVWLGMVAQFGGVMGSSPAVPDRLAVVQVRAGETLEQVAKRVAPEAPRGQVVERIRELNRLDSVAINAGQTLITPVG